MVKRIEIWPLPPQIPCPFCGKIFPSRLATFSHFHNCRQYNNYRKTHDKFDVKELIRTKTWLPYFFPEQHAAILKRKNRRKRITAPIPPQQPREK